MIYGYIRISTGKQEFKTQRHTLETYCKERGVMPDVWITEQASGAKKAIDRKLGELLETMQKGDLLVTTEVSRLGRSTLNVMSTLNYALEKGLRIWVVKGSFDLGDNIQSQLLAFAFAIGAQIEREMIISRTKQAIERKRSEGKSWGRPEGKLSSSYKLTGKEAVIASEVAKKTPFTEIAKLTGVDRRTVKVFADKILIKC